MNFTEIVKSAMKNKGLNTADVARGSGYSYQHIYDLLAGERRWNEESINRVSEVLGIQISFNIDDKQIEEAIQQ